MTHLPMIYIFARKVYSPRFAMPSCCCQVRRSDNIPSPWEGFVSAPAMPYLSPASVLMFNIRVLGRNSKASSCFSEAFALHLQAFN